MLGLKCIQSQDSYPVDQEPEIFSSESFEAGGGKDVVETELEVLQGLLLAGDHSGKRSKINQDCRGALWSKIRQPKVGIDYMLKRQMT